MKFNGRSCGGRMRRIALNGIVLTAPCLMWGGDWPQYRGANHDGVSRDRIVKDWSGTVTNPVWTVFFGNGLGSIAVSGGRVFTQTKRNVQGNDREVCVALSVTDGQELWATPLEAASYPDGGVGTDDGPRTTPGVADGAVFVLTSYLKLFRLDATNGSVTWQRDLRTLYGGKVIGWQNAASPLVEDGLVFVNANCGTNSLMALRTSDGAVAWRSQNESMTHSTPVLATIHSVRQVIFATQSGLVSLDPQTGNRLWKFPYPFTYFTSLSVSPVVWEDLVFICGAHSYGMGSVAFRADLVGSAWTTTQLWWTNNPTCHWMTPVVRDGFLYGHFGIQTYDSANAQLKCIDLRTGVQQWSVNGFGRGGTLLVDGQLLTVTERGDLVLARLDTNSYVEVSRLLAIPNYHGTTNKCWNVPAVADGRVFVRSTAQLACFDLSVPGLKMAPPQFPGGNQFRLTIGTADGSPVTSNRLAGLEALSSTNLGLSLTNWARLTNEPLLTNGVIEIGVGDTNTGPERYFIVREPQ